MEEGTENLSKAMAGSILAAVIIQLILALILLEGLEEVFKPPAVYGMLLLVAIAFYVYYHLLNSVRISRIRVKYLGPIGALLATVGIIVAQYHSIEAGGALIVAAYYSELLLGVKLREDLLQYKASGVNSFTAGMLIFILSLPLVILDNRLAAVPFAGNLLKTYGLVIVYRSIKSYSTS
ncbi:MAG: hypothetical protein GSR85_08190 [Desulfurococcales archaeon]|nr:hypothetical protein [Desulfurococcales archaeon]